MKESRTSISARLDLVTMDGNDEVGSCREVPVDRADNNPSPSCDVTDRHVDTGANVRPAHRGDL